MEESVTQKMHLITVFTEKNYKQILITKHYIVYHTNFWEGDSDYPGIGKICKQAIKNKLIKFKKYFLIKVICCFWS